MALLGFVAIWFGEGVREEQLWEGDGDAFVLFVVGSMAIGANEILGALQRFVKYQHDGNVKDVAEIHRSLLRYYPYDDLLPNVLRFVLPPAHMAETLTTTCVWAIAAYLLHVDFGMDEMWTGVILSGAAFVRILMAATVLSDPLRGWLMRSCCSLPDNNSGSNVVSSSSLNGGNGGGGSSRVFQIAFSGATCSALAMAVPNLYVFVSGFVFYNAFASLLSILLTEMVVGSTSAWESISTQTAR